MFLSLFSHNCDSLRCPVKKSCPYKVVAHGSEVCLHSHPLNCCHHYLEEMEHTLEECIGMFHHGSNTGYSKIPANTLYWQRMSPYGSIHGSIDPFAFRTEITLIPVTYYSRKTEIDL